jgi:hypothetical protein
MDILDFMKLDIKLLKKLYEGCDLEYYANFWGDGKELDQITSLFNFKKIEMQPQVEKFKEISCNPNLSKTSKDLFTTISPLYSIQKIA